MNRYMNPPKDDVPEDDVHEEEEPMIPDEVQDEIFARQMM
jgi:hypothetical protein